MIRPASRPALLALALLAAAPAVAEETRIGAAALVDHDVRRADGPKGAIASGDPIFRDEVVETGAGAAARFVFADDTNLAMGPSSRVVLDRFVYDDSRTWAKAGVGLAKGAFRFTTGHSPKEAYEIRTGTATIGVRGTVLNFLVTAGSTTVTLEEGAARVCGLGGGGRCTELTHPGDTVVVTAQSNRRSGKPFSFPQTVCNKSPDACTVSIGLDRQGDNGGGNDGGGGFPDGALCGR